jgi:hypothetical protein
MTSDYIWDRPGSVISFTNQRHKPAGTESPRGVQSTGPLAFSLPKKSSARRRSGFGPAIAANAGSLFGRATQLGHGPGSTGDGPPKASPAWGSSPWRPTQRAFPCGCSRASATRYPSRADQRVRRCTPFSGCLLARQDEATGTRVRGAATAAPRYVGGPVLGDRPRRAPAPGGQRPSRAARRGARAKRRTARRSDGGADRRI